MTRAVYFPKNVFSLNNLSMLIFLKNKHFVPFLKSVYSYVCSYIVAKQVSSCCSLRYSSYKSSFPLHLSFFSLSWLKLSFNCSVCKSVFLNFFIFMTKHNCTPGVFPLRDVMRLKLGFFFLPLWIAPLEPSLFRTFIYFCSLCHVMWLKCKENNLIQVQKPCKCFFKFTF